LFHLRIQVYPLSTELFRICGSCAISGFAFSVMFSVSPCGFAHKPNLAQ
jgi:hypothetical protein